MSVHTKSLLCLAVIATSLVACSKKEESAPAPSQAAPASTPQPAPAEPVTPATEEPPVVETEPPPAASSAPTPAETAPPPPTSTAPAASDAQAAEPEDVPEGKYAETIDVFKQAGASSTFFDKAYGYAVFPTVGKGGLGVGAARGKGEVYVGGNHVGNATLTQISVGLQAGGQAFSEIIFFEDKRAFDEFASGNFAFGAGVSAVAITAGASAGAGTTGGAAAGASATKNAATTAGTGYYKGMAVFTVAKGGLMYEAAIGGQKFKYEAV
jgi:lipid-binding SYLF domain-containing protein